MDGSGPRPVVLPAIHPVTLLRQVHGALILRLLIHSVTVTRVVLLLRFIRVRNPHISRVFWWHSMNVQRHHLGGQDLKKHQDSLRSGQGPLQLRHGGRSVPTASTSSQPTQSRVSAPSQEVLEAPGLIGKTPEQGPPLLESSTSVSGPVKSSNLDKKGKGGYLPIFYCNECRLSCASPDRPEVIRELCARRRNGGLCDCGHKVERHLRPFRFKWDSTTQGV